MIAQNIVSEIEFAHMRELVDSILHLPMTEDNHRFHRKFINNHPIFEGIHLALANKMSTLLGKDIVPSYSFLSAYNPGEGRCREHLDKHDCQYTVGVCIHQKGDWELKIEDESFMLEEGDSIFYSGTKHKHSRPDMIEGQECTMLLFHFVEKGQKMAQHKIMFQRIPEFSAPFVVFEGFFTKEECDKLILLGEREGFQDSTIGGGSTNSLFRSAKVAWLGHSVETSKFIDAITEAFSSINADYFNFELKTACLDLQVVKYEEGDFYTWHKDSGAGRNALRKLGMVILLNDTSDFEGGNLEFATVPNTDQPQLQQGSVIIFPAYEAHRVTEITRGKRYVLSTWAVGEPYR